MPVPIASYTCVLFADSKYAEMWDRQQKLAGGGGGEKNLNANTNANCSVAVH